MQRLAFAAADAVDDGASLLAAIACWWSLSSLAAHVLAVAWSSLQHPYDLDSTVVMDRHRNRVADGYCADGRCQDDDDMDSDCDDDCGCGCDCDWDDSVADVNLGAHPADPFDRDADNTLAGDPDSIHAAPSSLWSLLTSLLTLWSQ